MTDAPRIDLRAQWAHLEALGAVVHRHNIAVMPDSAVEALCEHEAARIRALDERDRPISDPPPSVCRRSVLREILELVADVVERHHNGDWPDDHPDDEPCDATSTRSSGRDQDLVVEDAPSGAEGPEVTPAPVALAPVTSGDAHEHSPQAKSNRRVPDWLDLDRLSGIVELRGWRQLAACKGRDPNWFHPTAEHKSSRQQKALCTDSCPVRYQCLAYVLATADTQDDCGIWGGTGPDERKAIRSALATRQQTRPGKAA